MTRPELSTLISRRRVLRMAAVAAAAVALPATASANETLNLRADFFFQFGGVPIQDLGEITARVQSGRKNRSTLNFAVAGIDVGSKQKLYVFLDSTILNELLFVGTIKAEKSGSKITGKLTSGLRMIPGDTLFVCTTTTFSDQTVIGQGTFEDADQV